MMKSNSADAYDRDLRECLYQALTGSSPWQHQTPRVLMSDLLRSRDSAPEPANDNLPEQLSFDFR